MLYELLKERIDPNWQKTRETYLFRINVDHWQNLIVNRTSRILLGATRFIGVLNDFELETDFESGTMFCKMSSYNECNTVLKRFF